jgi:hypothetical protein
MTDGYTGYRGNINETIVLVMSVSKCPYNVRSEFEETRGDKGEE